MEYYGHDNPFPWLVNTDYRAVRVGPHKYIRWIRGDGGHELYDLDSDPYEMANVAHEPACADVLAQAKSATERLVIESPGFSAG